VTSDETRRRVAHLLRRAGFGAGKDEVDRLAALGVEGAVDELLAYERLPDNLEETLKQVGGALLDVSTLEDAQTWWLYRMIASRRPLEEDDAFGTATSPPAIRRSEPGDAPAGHLFAPPRYVGRWC
jgi:hypothetical protein